MFFREKYSFQINQNTDVLTQKLKDLSKEGLVEKNKFSPDTFYSLEFNWDEFVVSRKAKLFERSAGIEPDTHIRLTSIAEHLTQIDVNWGYRILILLGSSAGLNLIMWVIFVRESNALKKVVTSLFESERL